MKKIYIKPTSEVVVINSEDIADGLPVGSQGATTTGDEAWTKQSSSWEDED